MAQDKKYAVRIVRRDGKGRYIQWCNDNWYETTLSGVPKFTQKEAYQIVNQMKKHYAYKFDIIREDGKVEHMNTLWRARHRIEKDGTPPKRKTIFKMVMNTKPMFKTLK